MEFLLDANLPKRLIKEIKTKYKFNCSRVSGGLTDEDIYRLCIKREKVLLTLDTDFLNILRYPPKKHPGIVVFRLKNQSYRQVVAAVFNFFESFQNQMNLLKGCLVIVREDRFKIFR